MQRGFSPTKDVTSNIDRIDLSDPINHILSYLSMRDLYNLKASSRFFRDAVNKELPKRFTVKKIVCGEEFTFALLENGKVYGWGFNLWGQLGLVHNRDLSKPTLIKGLPATSDIAAGKHHAIFS